MAKFALMAGAFAGLLAVAFGAFGAHALKNRLDAYAIGIFETAVQYQFYHALALLAVGLLLLQTPGSTLGSAQALNPALLKSSAVLFVVGMLIFSGSLYILSLTGLRWLGAVTPLGGLAFIAGWGCLLSAAWKLAN